MDIKKYLKESLVTPKLLTSSYCQFAIYNGYAPVPKYKDSVFYDEQNPNEKFNKLLYEGEADFNKGKKLTAQEIAFENYLVAIKTLLKDKVDLENNSSTKYNQGKIDFVIETLVNTANSYINKSKKKIQYNHDNFLDITKTMPEFAEIEPLMPSVVYYVALRQGWDLKYPEALTNYNKNGHIVRPLENEEIEFSSSNKVTGKDMIQSIGGKTGINYEKFYKEAETILS